MQIQKPSINIKSFPKIAGPRPDFRFGPVDAAVLVILATAAAIIYGSIAPGDTLPGILATILGSLAIVFILRSAPLWESVIVASVAVWVVMHLWIKPTYEWLLTGTLIGGSLTLLAASLGTPWELDTRGAILLFEDVSEKPYALDRLLQQLRAAGKLDDLAGVGVGHLIDCVDPKRETPSAEDVVLEALSPLGVPIVLGLPFGHGRPNLTWPFGVRGALDGGRGALEILEAGVERG